MQQSIEPKFLPRTSLARRHLVHRSNEYTIRPDPEPGLDLALDAERIGSLGNPSRNLRGGNLQLPIEAELGALLVPNIRRHRLFFVAALHRAAGGRQGHSA